MKDHTFSVPCMIITDFVMEARPFFESQIKIKDSSRYLLSKIPVLQQSAVGSSLVGEFSLCDIMKNGFKRQDYGLNFFPYLLIMMNQYHEQFCTSLRLEMLL